MKHYPATDEASQLMYDLDRFGTYCFFLTLRL